MESCQVSTLTRVWKELIPFLMDEFEGLKVLEKEGSADVVERVRELELEVEAENVTKLLQSHDEA